jgi:hypothetical protein
VYDVCGACLSHFDVSASKALGPGADEMGWWGVREEERGDFI